MIRKVKSSRVNARMLDAWHQDRDVRINQPGRGRRQQLDRAKG